MRFLAIPVLLTLSLAACGGGTNNNGKTSGSGGAGASGGAAGQGGAGGGETGGAGATTGSGGAGGSSSGTGGAGTGGSSSGTGGAGTGGSGGGMSAGPSRVVGYFTAWAVYDRQYFMKDVESSGSAAKLTHINYAFANLQGGEAVLGDSYADIDMAYQGDKSVDGTSDKFDAGVLRGNFNQLRELKVKHPGLKALISIGGASWSYNFPTIAATAASRKKFVDSAVDRFIRGNFAAGVSGPGIFDGIDIDWEYVEKADSSNFTALLSDLRAALDTQGQQDGKKYLLTIAAPAGPDHIANIQLDKVAPLLDWINLMAYDYHGSWEGRTNFHAALYGAANDPDAALGFNTDNVLKLYLSGGVPAAKMVLGVPFYGRGWSGVDPGPAGDGLWQNGSGPAPAKYEAGIEDYKILKGLEGTFQKYTHPETKAFYIYNPQSKTWWNYDTPASLQVKVDYIKAKGLGGAMFWELSGDDANGSLISVLGSLSQ
jgi:chitinase